MLPPNPKLVRWNRIPTRQYLIFLIWLCFVKCEVFFLEIQRSLNNEVRKYSSTEYSNGKVYRRFRFFYLKIHTYLTAITISKIWVMRPLWYRIELCCNMFHFMKACSRTLIQTTTRLWATLATNTSKQK